MSKTTATKEASSSKVTTQIAALEAKSKAGKKGERSKEPKDQIEKPEAESEAARASARVGGHATDSEKTKKA